MRRATGLTARTGLPADGTVLQETCKQWLAVGEQPEVCWFSSARHRLRAHSTLGHFSVAWHTCHLYTIFRQGDSTCSTLSKSNAARHFMSWNCGLERLCKDGNILATRPDALHELPTRASQQTDSRAGPAVDAGVPETSRDLIKCDEQPSPDPF